MNTDLVVAPVAAVYLEEVLAPEPWKVAPPPPSINSAGGAHPRGGADSSSACDSTSALVDVVGLVRLQPVAG